MGKIQVKRGPEANLPTLDIGEPAFTVDEKNVYFGSSSGNIKLVNETHLLDDMPHQTTDPTTSKTYTYGIAMRDGVIGILMEEVV